MPSAPGIIAANAQQTEEVYLCLLEFTHPSTPTLRVVNNPVAITHGGNEYLAAAFEIALPDDIAGVPQVSLSIDNVDRAVVDLVRSLASPPTITMKIILASTPDVLEAGPFGLTVAQVTHDALKVEGTLIYEDLLNEQFPCQTFNPSRYPALF